MKPFFWKIKDQSGVWIDLDHVLAISSLHQYPSQWPHIYITCLFRNEPLMLTTEGARKEELAYRKAIRKHYSEENIKQYALEVEAEELRVKTMYEELLTAWKNK